MNNQSVSLLWTWIWWSARKLCCILAKSQDTCGKTAPTSWIPDTTNTLLAATMYSIRVKKLIQQICRKNGLCSFGGRVNLQRSWMVACFWQRALKILKPEKSISSYIHLQTLILYEACWYWYWYCWYCQTLILYEAALVITMILSTGKAV